MFQAGDLLVYGGTGVCRVVEMCIRDSSPPPARARQTRAAQRTPARRRRSAPAPQGTPAQVLSLIHIYTGSFALNAALGGAKKVTAVDVSAAAVAMARRNAGENGVAGVMECVAADVFELLPGLAPHAYDFIILDPPAFTKSHKTLANALRGYKEINYLSLIHI